MGNGCVGVMRALQALGEGSRSGGLKYRCFVVVWQGGGNRSIVGGRVEALWLAWWLVRSWLEEVRRLWETCCSDAKRHCCYGSATLVSYALAVLLLVFAWARESRGRDGSVISCACYLSMRGLNVAADVALVRFFVSHANSTSL